MNKEISHQRRSMMALRYTSASSSDEMPLHHLTMTRRSSIGHSAFSSPSAATSAAAVGSDLSAMNSLQLYQATGETKTSSLLEKGKMIATESNSRDGKSKSTVFFPPFFHNSSKTDQRQFVDFEAEAALVHDSKVVAMIQTVVGAPVESITATTGGVGAGDDKPLSLLASLASLATSPTKKQAKHKMTTFIRVTLHGEFKVFINSFICVFF
jgi:hypothetical protein